MELGDASKTGGYIFILMEFSQSDSGRFETLEVLFRDTEYFTLSNV